MQVTCPCPCGVTFEAQRSQHGAAYALKWKKLPKDNLHLLKWWRSSLWAASEITKEEIKLHYRYVDVDGLNARISELKALEFVKPTGRGIYRLNIEKTDAVIARNGLLKE